MMQPPSGDAERITIRSCLQLQAAALLGPEVVAMKQYDELREQAREKLRLAACATDRATKQHLAEAAFQLAQQAEALERAEKDARRKVSGGRYD